MITKTDENGQMWVLLVTGSNETGTTRVWLPIGEGFLNELSNWNPQSEKNVVEQKIMVRYLNENGETEKLQEGDIKEEWLPDISEEDFIKKWEEEKEKERQDELNATTEEGEGSGEEEASELETKQLELVNKQIAQIDKEYAEDGTGYRDRENALVEKEIINKHGKKIISNNGIQTTYESYYDVVSASSHDDRVAKNAKMKGQIKVYNELGEILDKIGTDTKPTRKYLKGSNDYNSKWYDKILGFFGGGSSE